MLSIILDYYVLRFLFYPIFVVYCNEMNVNILKSATLLIIVLFSCFLKAQNTEKYHFNCVNNTEKISFFDLDSYGNIYTIENNTIISKYNNQGKLLNSFSNPNYGTITSIDISNPDKVLVFYKDAAIILFLNEQFAPLINPINLFNLNYFNITLVSATNANTICIFDQTNLKLIILDLFLKEKSQFQLLNTPFNPIKMVSWGNNKLVIHDPKVGFLFFDNFGTLEKEIALLVPNDFQINDTKILFLQDSIIKEYNFEKLEMLQTPLSDIVTDASLFKTIKKSGPFLVGLDDKGILYIGKKIF